MLALPKSRSWFYAPMLRCTYTTSATQPKLEFSGINKNRFSAPAISTLRPEKLVYSDFFALAGISQMQCHTQLSLRSPPKQGQHNVAICLYYYTCRIGKAKHVELKDDAATITNGVASKVKGARMFVPFPGHSRGFLYLHQPPPESGLPRAASSVRFRCTPSLEKASSSYVASVGIPKSPTRPLVLLPSSIKGKKVYEAFKAGYDLSLPNGTPWDLSVISIAARSSLEFVRLQLLEDKLFSESEMQEYEDIYKYTSHTRGSILLYSLNDVFPVKFGQASFNVWAVTTKDRILEGMKTGTDQKGSRGTSVFGELFLDKRRKIRTLPYTGGALARFELAAGSKPRKPILSLRIVKITEPVKCVVPDYDGYVHIPKEGELVTRGLPGKEGPWTCHLDPSVPRHSAMLRFVSGYYANL